MKASVLDNVLLGAGAKLAGYIRNDGPKRMCGCRPPTFDTAAS